MIKIAIIEDEAIAIRQLQRMILEMSFDIKIVATIQSVANAIKVIPTLEVDLFLMDIHLTDGNAFQIFSTIEITTPIIFTTAFDQYTLKAFKQTSIDYLLKPIDKTELEHAIQKFENQFLAKKKAPEHNYQTLIELLANKKDYKKRFLVQVGKKMKTIEIKAIAYFFVADKTTYLQTVGNKNYIIDYSLSQLENQLDSEIFYRVNRQYLVTNKAIVDIYYLSTTKLVVNLNPPAKADVFVTIDKIGKFKRWLNE